ncbi:hypothetical protein SAMD00019534_118870 [Acytostelium subglobosum LB1]|uniref:hypothetical protein n=1 Tax=Acytostelium subglobosum LB1 TaxID=1410327 RepID=UPI00064505F8|nr:hypothetical protein SAMD00019534_118870 [Acytostelium subglobosum LB1]GAM28711.1 hypothetical protein SAMD00019534_118870 [Acytostelium subglobosum LB1]|eukprot:XP_012748266.1 hypothetical protein SAMD00019534_118870 [Acytostelium subglobosum LB1]
MLFQSVSRSSDNRSPSPSATSQNDNVMRFFQGIPSSSPSSATTTTANIQQQSTSPPNSQSNTVSFIENSFQQTTQLSSSEGIDKPKSTGKASIGGALLTNLSQQSSNVISHAGVYLHGKSISVDEAQPMKKLVDLESQPITLIPSTIRYLWGSLISVNDNFICYVVKNEKIRVLQRSSIQRALIKDIHGIVTDIQFIDDKVDLLSCTTENGIVYIFDIGATSSTINPQLLYQYKIAPNSNEEQKPLLTPKVCWSPEASRSNISFTVAGGGLSSLMVFGPESTSTGRWNHITLASSSNTIGYDASGKRLVYGTEGGVVGVYDLSQNRTESEHTYSSMVTFVSFIDDKKLLVGLDNNREIHVVSLPKFETIQTLRIINGTMTQSLMAPIILAYKDSFLFAIYTTCSRGYILHVESESTSSTHFDYISEFDLKKPLLSFTVRPAILDSKPSGSTQLGAAEEERKDKKFNFFSVQDHAVNFHSIIESAIYLPTDSYSTDDSTITQTGSIGQQSSLSSSGSINRSAAPQQVSSIDEELLTPGKLFVPSSPPPLSLPDPSLLTVEQQLDSTDGQVPQQQQKTISTKSLNKNGKVSLNSAEALLPVADITNPEPLLSPSAILQQQQQQQPNELKTQSPTPTRQDKSVVSTSPKPAPKSQTPSKTKVNVTPLFKQATINIPSTAAPTTTTSTNQVAATQPSPPLPTSTTPSNGQPETSPLSTHDNSPPTSSLTGSSDVLLQQQGIRSDQLVSSLQATIHNTVKAVLKKELAPIIEKGIATSQEALMAKTTQEVMKKVTAKSDAALKTSVDSISSQLKATINESVSATVKPMVETIFMNYFQTVLVPGFEKSCNLMFKHLSASFEKGMTESIQSQSTSTQTQLQSIKTLTDQLKQEREAHDQEITSLTKKQQDLQSDMKYMMSYLGLPPPPSAAGAGLVHPTPTPQSPINGISAPPQHASLMNNIYMQHQQQQQQQQQRQFFSPQATVVLPVAPQRPRLQAYPDLKSMVDSGNYVGAFNQALNASNVAMVADLCASLDTSDIFSQQHAKVLPNATTLSLIHQLSHDLSTDVDLKLKWIKEALGQLDSSDQAIMSVIARVMNGLKQKIEHHPSLSSKDYYTQPILASVRYILSSVGH